MKSRLLDNDMEMYLTCNKKKSVVSLSVSKTLYINNLADIVNTTIHIIPQSK